MKLLKKLEKLVHDNNEVDTNLELNLDEEENKDSVVNYILHVHDPEKTETQKGLNRETTFNLLKNL